MQKFLIFASYAGNGNINYHIRRIVNPKPHELRQAISVHESYEAAAAAKKAIVTPPSFNKPHYLSGWTEIDTTTN